MEKNMEIDLQMIFKMLIKRMWIILLCAVLVAGAVLLYTVNFVVPQYEASITVYVNNKTSQESGAVSSSDLAVALRLVSTYINIVSSERVLNRVIDETGLMLTANQIRPMITAEAEGETEMFRITVTSPNPQMSADIANTIGKVAPAEIADIIEGSSAKVIDSARVPESRCSPSYTFNTIVGAFVGGCLACIVLVVLHVTDGRVKSEEDLKAICDVPVLGVIPNLTTDAKSVVKRTRR